MKRFILFSLAIIFSPVIIAAATTRKYFIGLLELWQKMEY